jgi:DNA mismatch repair protein MSH3
VAVEMAKRKLDILIVEYRKQLGMRNLEYKTIAGTTYLIEVKSISSIQLPSDMVVSNGKNISCSFHYVI